MGACAGAGVAERGTDFLVSPASSCARRLRVSSLSSSRRLHVAAALSLLRCSVRSVTVVASRLWRVSIHGLSGDHRGVGWRRYRSATPQRAMQCRTHLDAALADAISRDSHVARTYLRVTLCSLAAAGCGKSCIVRTFLHGEYSANVRRHRMHPPCSCCLRRRDRD